MMVVRHRQKHQCLTPTIHHRLDVVLSSAGASVLGASAAATAGSVVPIVAIVSASALVTASRTAASSVARGVAVLALSHNSLSVVVVAMVMGDP